MINTTAITTFGRFNIVHSGHNSVLEYMSQLTDIVEAEIVVGISSSNRRNRNCYSRLADYRAVCNDSISYSTCLCNNLYSYCIMMSESYNTVILCLGSDRIAQTERLLASAGITNIILHEIERDENSPSSTALRNIHQSVNGDFDSFVSASLTQGLLSSEESARIAFEAILAEG